MIVLQFSKQPGIASQAIRWFTWSSHSHVDFVLSDGRLLGATTDGVTIRDDGRWSRMARVGVDVPASVIDVAMTQIGKPYDWTGILGFPFRSNWQDPGRWFCSELVAWAFDQAGFPLLRAEHLSRITPRDLWMSPKLRTV